MYVKTFNLPAKNISVIYIDETHCICLFREQKNINKGICIFVTICKRKYSSY